MTDDAPQLEGPGPGETPPPAQPIQPAGPAPAPRKPAITLTIQSWATPIVGAAMLGLGMLIGYFVRPAVSARIAALAPTATAPATPAAAAAPQAQPQSREELMAYLISQTRHFRGNPEAPIVLLEFSDFQ